MRLAAALLLAASSILVACAPPTAPALAFSPGDSTAYVAAVARATRKAERMKIHEEYDRITGQTTVSLPLLRDGGLSTDGIRLIAFFQYRGEAMLETPAEVLLTADWEDYGGSTTLLDSPDAHFLVDDSVRFTVPGRDWQRYVDRSFLQIAFDDSTFRQRVTLAVPRADFARLTAARRVEGRLTSGQRIRLGLEHILALRRLEERMTVPAR